MVNKLKFAIWNANGLSQHRQEVYTFIVNLNIDIMMISETHFTKKNFLKIHNYSIYHTMHPDGTAHGGTAIIIKNTIKHHETTHFREDYIQATNVVVEDWTGHITFSAIYCPPKHTIKKNQFETFFNTLGNRFICGGDYNAKHQLWGSRLPTPKGRELYKAIEAQHLQVVSSGEPTYWPTDRRKIPDIIDFSVIKGINKSYLKAESCLDLSSDHSPVIITLSSKILGTEKSCMLSNNKTDWDYYRLQINSLLDLKISLKTESEITQAVEHFNRCVQLAGWNATPPNSNKLKNNSCTATVRDKIAYKRRIRKIWQNNRSPELKRKLNKATKELKNMILTEKNRGFQEYLKNLDATETSDYSLWKATKKLKGPRASVPPIRIEENKWARNENEKAEAFAKHLTETFTPNLEKPIPEDEKEIHTVLAETYQLELPIKNFTKAEVKSVIRNDIHPKKAPGYDLITGRVLQEMPEKGFVYLTQLFNSVLRTNFYPPQWKVAQIIPILKPGKDPVEVKSYRPISLLPIISKVFEKLLLRKLRPIIEERRLIPNHQFGFRQQHATTEQVHRVVNKISSDFEEKRYCSAVFLDVGQAFDKVWHTGLLYKLKRMLPINYFLILKSYLADRHFLIKYQSAYTQLQTIQAGVPQGSVLGPVLYLLYTADLPTSPGIITATFADDTAILASNSNPKTASELLQKNLNQIQHWLKKWRIKINESKSTHVTFTNRNETCPPVRLNKQEIPQADEVKYLGMHLDRRLTWKKHIFTKRKQLGYKLSKLYWLIGRKSELSTDSKLLVYKSILKPVWTYGLQLWGTASNSNVEILQRFQSKVLRMVVDAPWYVTNETIHRDLQIPYVKEEIQNSAKRYNARLTVHPNVLAEVLMRKPRIVRRLRRKLPADLVNEKC